MDVFTILSASGDPVIVPRDPSIIAQSPWLKAAVDIGEEEGVMPLASTKTLQCLVAYMKLRASSSFMEEDDDWEIDVPISCTCLTSVAGLGYDVNAMLSSSDIAFLEDCIGPCESSWNLEKQELLLELLVAADFIGLGRLRSVCAVYFACRIMSSTESDILRWFGKELRQNRNGSDDDDDDGVVPGDKYENMLLLLSDEDRLHVLREMRRIMLDE